MTRRAIVALALLASCALTMGAGWLSGPRFGVGIGSGFAPTVRGVAGTVDYCLYFDGDDYVSAVDTGLPDGAEEFSIMFWAKTNDAGNNFRCFYSYGNGVVQQTCWTTNVGAGNYFYWTPTNPYFRDSGQASDFGSWKNYTLTSSGTYGNIKFYVDGVEISNTSRYYQGCSAGSAINVALNGNSFTLGKIYRENLQYFKGWMDEIAVFNKVLSQSEIQSLYPNKFSGTESSLIRLYHCDDGSGTNLAESISGYNGTLSGATWSTR